MQRAIGDETFQPHSGRFAALAVGIVVGLVGGLPAFHHPVAGGLDRGQIAVVVAFHLQIKHFRVGTDGLDDQMFVE